jgi:ParB family chromosome partitioning protein
MMQLREVDPYTVRVPDWDIRFKRDPEWVQSFMAVIARDGVKDPIVIYEPDDFKEHGEYELIDGKTRLFAARMAKLKTIPALVVDKPREDVVLEAGYRNLWQKDLDPISAALHVERVVKKHMMNFEAASRELGISEKHIRRLLKLLSLPEDVKEKIALGEAPVFTHEGEIAFSGQHVPKGKKRGGTGQRCVICGRWPQEGNRKWILICAEHEAEINAIMEYILSMSYKENV